MRIKIKRSHLLLIAVLVVGLVLRCAFLYYFKDSVFFNPYMLDRHDQKTFILWAQQILKNPWLVNGEAFYMAPLYAYFLAFLHLFTLGNIVAIAVVQLLMDIAIIFLLYYIGKKIYNEWTGIAAAFLACFYRTSIVYASSILSDGLIYFLYILFIALIYFALEKPGIFRWIIAGIVLGLAALSKPTIAVFLPFLFIGLYLYPAKSLIPGEMGRKVQPLVILGLLLFSSGLIILPVTIRNYVISGQFVPICTNGPINWQIGNSKDSMGLFCYPEGPLLNPLSLSFWKLFSFKMQLFFTSYEWPQNLDVQLIEKIIPILKAAFVKFGFIVPVGVAGLILLFKDWKKNFIFITYTLSNILWVVLFFITDRYRLPAIGCFAVSAGLLLVWSFERLREKRLLQPLLLFLIAALFAYFFNTRPGPLIPEVSYKVFSGLSIRQIQNDLKENKIEKAHRKAITYYKFAPGDDQSNFLLACTFLDKGETEISILLLENAIRINPEFQLARDMLKDLTQE